MKPFFCLIFAAMFCLFFPLPVLAAGRSSSVPAVKPEINVEIDNGKPAYLYKNKKVPCGDGSDGHTLGCTRVSFYAEMRGAEMTPDGALKKIKLLIGLKNVEVELSSELVKGSCLFDVVLKHELTHLALHRGILKRFSPEIAKAVLSAADKIPVPLTQSGFDKLAKVLHSYADKMMREDERQNNLMDSSNAYRFQQEQCRKKR